jgi:hypothetical protein
MWLGLILTLISCVITVLVALHYFRRTVDKKLASYIISAVSLLADADDEVAAGLKVYYRGAEVSDPYQIHYGIFNMMDLPITNCVEPLSINIPKGVKVVEAKVVSVHPEGRKVDKPKVHGDPDGSTQVIFPFKILNKREGFVVRLLLDGMLDPRELKFQIQAEGLPPMIEPEIGTYYIDVGPKFNWKAVIYGVPIFVGGIGSYYGSELFRDAHQISLYHFSWHSILLTILVVGWGLATALTILMGLFIAIGVGIFPLLTRQPHASRFISPLFGYGWKGPATRIEIPAEKQPEQSQGQAQEKENSGVPPPPSGKPNRSQSKKNHSTM